MSRYNFPGISLLIGAAGFFDLRLLGLVRGISIHAASKLIPWAKAALFVNFVTGLIFLISEPEQYTINVSMWFKMAFLLVAGANALVFERVYARASATRGYAVGGKSDWRLVARLLVRCALLRTDDPVSDSGPAIRRAAILDRNPCKFNNLRPITSPRMPLYVIQEMARHRSTGAARAVGSGIGASRHAGGIRSKQRRDHHRRAEKINWFNPHVNFLLDVKEPDGALTTWTLVHAGPNQMRAAGLSDRDFWQLGKTYTAILALARNGSPRGRSGCRTANPISAGAGATAAATSAAMRRRGTGSTRRQLPQPSQRPEGSPVNQERDAGLSQRFFSNVPIYKPEHWERVDYLDVNGNAEDTNFHCFPAGVPRMGAPMKIMATPTEVVLLYLAKNTWRYVPLNRKHDPRASKATAPTCTPRNAASVPEYTFTRRYQSVVRRVRMKTFNLRLLSGVTLAVAIVLSGAGAAAAQGLAEGSIIGRVVDQTKAVLPGVTVTATNVATGFQRTSVTEGDGVFRLVALPPAEYEVSAELSGFSTVRSRLVVTVASEANLELALSVATLTESITVSGEAPLIEVTQTQQAVTINQREIEGLPTNSRNFLEFALLSPGVVRGRSGGAGFGGENGFSTSGNRGDQNGINIDGVSNKSLDNGLEQTTFSSEGVQEFNVVTQGYPAEFGGAAGGVINAVSKSGTNNFNGYGYGFIRSDAFDKPVFNTVTDPTTGIVTAEPAAQAAEFNRSVTGLTIGGPIRQDQMFFFGLAEITRSNTPRLQNIVQPTLDSVRQIAIPDLPDREANVIRQFKPRNNKGNIKVDWNLSNTQNVSIRSSYNSNFSPGGIPNGRNSITGANESKDRTYVIAGSLNTIPSNRMLNTVRFSLNREDSWVEFPALGGRENIRNFPPRIQIGGNTGGNFGRGNGGGGEHNFETKWEFNDTVTLYRNSHTFKVGGQYLFSQFQQINNYGPDGVWDFSDINAFRAGLPTAFFQTWGHGGVYLKVHYFSGFAQDQWQPRPGLTIDYGVRYQYDHHPNDISSYTLPEKIFNPMTLERTDQAGSPGMKGFNNDNNNIMPRLGVAWTPDGGKTLFHGAAGSFYGIQYLGEIANPMGWNGPPSSYRFTFSQVEAREIWAGTVNPASPYYNPLGIRRLPANYYDRVLVPQRIPPTDNVFDTNLKTPMSWQANVGVDRQLTQRIAVSGSFLWSRGYNNIRNVNKNPQGGVTYSQGALLPSGRITPFDVVYRQGPRPDPNFSEVWTYGNYGTMKFKGLTGSISSRWTHLQLRASVTWNDSWDDSVAISFRQGPSNPDCVSCEWSRSVTNSTRFVGSAVYMTPQTWGIFGRDWQVATIFEYEGGHPYQVLSGFDTNNDTIAADRPLGVPRNSLITDPYKNVDFRFSRTLPIRGDVKVEVLFELFNAFNWANYTTYVDSLYVLQGGQYVPRPDFAAFQSSPNLNVLDTHRDPDEIGLDSKQRRNGVGDPMRGQLGFRFRF